MASSIDPVDDCTFFYTTEYLKTNGTFNWNTRIASFKFPSCAPPAAPTGLSAVAGSAQVSLSWNPSTTATSYNVLRSTTNGGPYATVVTGLTTTSYTDNGLSNGTTYYYVVQAVNAVGPSQNSNQASATPVAAPGGLAATAGNAQVSLTWNASSGATSYNVYRSTTNGGPYTKITNVATTSYTNTGLSNGTTYYYVVTAANANGESSNSNQASATPSGSSSWSNGYTYLRAITIDHTKVPNTDQTNFPVLFSGTYAYLATTNNGGNVTNANGYDIIFTSDAGGTSPLAFETESYNASTGAVNFWVKVPTVSHTTDTVIYMFYGNPSVTADQSNKTGVWDSNYKLVWHLPNGNVLSTNDSTSNGSNGSNSGTSATTGEIDGGGLFNGSSSKVSINNTSSIDVTAGNFTVDIWFYANSYSSYNTVFDKGAGGSRDYSFWINSASDGWWSAGSSSGVAWNSPGFTAGAWHYLAIQRSGSVTTAYLDGSAAFNTSQLTGTNDTGGELDISGNPTGGGSLWNGKLDEFRVSNTARSADWIRTEYNNQNGPSSFYAIGAAATAGP